MLMIKCTKCGKDIPDKAKFCPNCGYPTNYTDDANKNDITNGEKENSKASKTNKLKTGIQIFVICFLGCAFWGTFLYIFGQTDDISLNENVSAEIAEESNADKTEPYQEQDFDAVKNNKSQDSDLRKEQEKKDDIVKNEDSEIIFATELLNSWSDYIGKWVTVSYACGDCEDDEERIQSTYDDEARLYLRSYVDNYRQFAYGDYITVTGIVDSQYASYIEIKNAHIDNFGSDSQLAYEQGKNEYEEQKRIKAEEYEAEFKESVESPTYDDLLRYPDSYKDIKIKVKVKVTRVEPDGLIFDGDIEATMNGEKVALYDGRETKEPKLREGDFITIYGYGKGVTTVKVQDVSGWLPKTVDKYDIPSIDMRYIEFN